MQHNVSYKTHWDRRYEQCTRLDWFKNHDLTTIQNNLGCSTYLTSISGSGHASGVFISVNSLKNMKNIITHFMIILQ